MKDKFKIDWTVNLGEILSLLTIIIFGMVFILRLEGRVMQNTNNIEHNVKRIETLRYDNSKDTERLLQAIYHLSDRIELLSNRIDKKEDRK